MAICKALSFSALVRATNENAIPIVYYVDTRDEHFSPLLGLKRDRLVLPFSELAPMTRSQFMRRWANAAVCRQCVIMKRGLEASSAKKVAGT